MKSLAHVMSLPLGDSHFSIGGLLCPFSDESLDLLHSPKRRPPNLNRLGKLPFLNHEPELRFRYRDHLQYLRDSH